MWQTPPVYSALKLNRRRYSDLARYARPCRVYLYVFRIAFVLGDYFELFEENIVAWLADALTVLLHYREGVQVVPKERLVRCYSAECTDFSPPFFTLHVRCGGGFYIRSLVHDLGRCKYLVSLKPCVASHHALDLTVSETDYHNFVPPQQP